MTDNPTDAPAPPPAESPEALRKQLDAAHHRLLQSELKSHALRAGIIDVDGLKMMDTSTLKLDDNGHLPDPTAALATFKRDKPWLFRQASSGNPSSPPAPESPKSRTVKEMSYEEWQAARNRLIRGR